MTRKDYQLIATALAEHAQHRHHAACKLTPALRADWIRIVVRLAHALQADNSRFNKARFILAAGMTDQHRSDRS